MPNKEQKIVDLLTPYANEMDDPRLGQFLTLSVGRVLMNAYKDTAETPEASNNELRHITDWLKASIINNASWLTNLDTDQRPKKLMKFNSIKQIKQEADKAMLVAAQKNIGSHIKEGEEVLFLELADGYSLVKMLTPKALDRESSYMQHCIGQGAYDDYLNDENHIFLSLRDPAGNPHVTIEIKFNEIIQLQGKQNTSPIKKYLDILTPFLKDQIFSDYITHTDLGHVLDINDLWHPIDNIPENTIINHHLNLSYSNIKKLPKNLTIKGDLNLTRSNIEEIGDNIKIEGSLFLVNTKIKKLPDNIEINENINLTFSEINELPKSIKTINGDLTLEASSLKTINSNTHIKNNLFAQSSNLVSIGDNVIIDKQAIITNKHLETIGINFTCDICDLEGTQNLKQIGNGFNVARYCNLYNSNLATLPDNASFVSLSVQGSNITNFPEDIKINANLFLDHNKDYILPTSIADNVNVFTSEDNMTAQRYRQMHNQASLKM